MEIIEEYLLPQDVSIKHVNTFHALSNHGSVAETPRTTSSEELETDFQLSKMMQTMACVIFNLIPLSVARDMNFLNGLGTIGIKKLNHQLNGHSKQLQCLQMSVNLQIIRGT